jgi:Na+/H+-dicarboxylate symporter
MSVESSVEKKSNRKKLTTSWQIVIGLVGGVLAGLFFGERLGAVTARKPRWSIATNVLGWWQ